MIFMKTRANGNIYLYLKISSIDTSIAFIIIVVNF